MIFHPDAKLRAADPAISFQVINHPFHRIGRNGQADPLGTADLCRVDADHFAFKVYQGTAAVARIDHRIGLNVGISILAVSRPDFTLQGANDPPGNCMFKKAQRIPHSEHRLANLDGIGIADVYKRQPSFP